MPKKILLIANPAAQNGNVKMIAEQAEQTLKQTFGPDKIDLVMTERPKHATEIAAESKHYSALIALGGDGIVHEVVNGIMQIKDRSERPVLGVLPVGSGNDFARTLGLSTLLSKVSNQLLKANKVSIDVGKVNNDYFTETLSFGLDAAIALDTVERRKRTGRSGTLLYMASGIDQLRHNLNSYDYTVSFDGGPVISGKSITFAVQNGPYYGGGFKIAPNANITDGILNVCIAHPPIGIAKALVIFLLAKSGHHGRFKNIEVKQAKSLHVEFSAHPPTQIDGEDFAGTVFDISVVPDAIDILMPTDSEQNQS